MRVFRAGIWCLICSAYWLVVGLSGSHGRASAQLHWEEPKKEQVRVRLVALALADPRSSFFSSHEVFVAEKQVGREEWSMVKLVYGFLPYQPRLSERGLEYSTVYEIRAVRDPGCDQTVGEMKSGQWSQPERSHLNWRYARNSPISDVERRHSSLPCYLTSADDYERSVPDNPEP